MLKFSFRQQLVGKDQQIFLLSAKFQRTVVSNLRCMTMVNIDFFWNLKRFYLTIMSKFSTSFNTVLWCTINFYEYTFMHENHMEFKFWYSVFQIIVAFTPTTCCCDEAIQRRQLLQIPVGYPVFFLCKYQNIGRIEGIGVIPS